MTQSRNDKQVDKILSDLRQLLNGVGNISAELKSSLEGIEQNIDKILRGENNQNRQLVVNQITLTLINGQSGGQKRISDALSRLADTVNQINKQAKTPANDTIAKPEPHAHSPRRK